jgi:cytoskeletal protein CcmA (bactofilin family)
MIKMQTRARIARLVESFASASGSRFEKSGSPEIGLYVRNFTRRVVSGADSSEVSERKYKQMWKPNQPGSPSPSSSTEPARPAVPSTPNSETMRPSGASPASQAIADQATIGKSLVVKGEVTGSESLYIDGKVEGAINLPGNRVTVGRNGQVSANISAREVVVLGKVRGNINASDRVDIRSEGSLTGDVIAQRISIEDGAFFKGGIDIRKPGQTKDGAVAAVNSAVVEPQKVAATV